MTSFGSPNETGHYDGLVGLLQRDRGLQEADVSVVILPTSVRVNGVSFTSTITERSAAIFQNYKRNVGDEVDIFGQFVSAYSTSCLALIVLSIASLTFLLDRTKVLSKPGSPGAGPRHAQKPHGFSVWTMATSLMLQSVYDPLDKMRRFLFTSYLLLVFLVYSVAWNYVGTKRIVTQSYIARSLGDLEALKVSKELLISGNDWPAAKFRDPRVKMAHKVYKKHCEPRKKDCLFDLDRLSEMVEYVSNNTFKLVSEQISTELLSRYYCAATLAMNGQRKFFSKSTLNEINEPFAVAYNSRIGHVYKAIIDLTATKVLEAGLGADILMELGMDYEDELLYSWKTCTMVDTLDKIAGEFREISTNDFSLMVKLAYVVLTFALLLHVKQCCYQGRSKRAQLPTRLYYRYNFVHGRVTSRSAKNI
ncbi:hypothetical protein HDE_01658 [Halotydeus destructor]|nr:hypothetical protein HDE_01658 [Halotydeus destructor]